MSLWAKVQSLPAPAIQKVHCLYGDHFPIEVRYVLAQWIEERMAKLEQIDPDNPAHEQYVAQFVQALISELEGKANSMVNEGDPYLIRVKLVGAAGGFRHRYTLDPGSLFRYIRHCLTIESSLVECNTFSTSPSSSSSSVFPTTTTTFDSSNNTLFQDFNTTTNIPQQQNQQQPYLNNIQQNSMATSSTASSSAEIMEKLSLLKHRTVETTDLLRRMEQEQEAFALKCHDRQKLEGIIHLHRMQQQQNTAQPQQQAQVAQTQAIEKNFLEQKQRLEYELKQRITTLLQLKQELEEKIAQTVGDLGNLQGKILDQELTRWKREQQLAGNGAPLSNNLDTLQNWCEDLAELIWHNRHQLKEIERIKTQIPVFQQQNASNDRIPQLQEKVTQLLSSLVTSTFIVEKQPPQVMKTNTRFTSTVRLLVGGRLNVHMTPPQVKVAIISEQQANSLLRQDKSDKPCDTSGEILNNTGTMEYHQGTRHLSVHFRNMQLKRIKRAEKKGTESVMDEKFCLHFQCQFTVGEKELIFKIWTLSLPVVVIVHGNQEPHAWATVTWDNAFGEPGRMPFQVPERVPWFRVAQALNVKFKSLTGRALTEDNLRFLAEKAFRSSTPFPPPSSAATSGGSGSPTTNNSSYEEHSLTWSQFCKEPLPDRNFTFWEWFYAIMKLTREHLRGPWVDGSILGFVGRNQAEENLGQCLQSGTFLLRYSDSELGGITIAWVHNDQKVFSLAPFTSKDLATRSLADRVNDIGHLIYLYPDVPKTTAFGKYFTPLQETPPQCGKGYVKPLLKTHIPGLGDPSSTPNNTGVGGVDFGSSSIGSPAYSQGSISHPGTPAGSSLAHFHNPTSPGSNYGDGNGGMGGGGDFGGDNLMMGGAIGGMGGASNSASDPFMDLESLEQYAGISLDDIDLTMAIDSYMSSVAGIAAVSDATTTSGGGGGGSTNLVMNNLMNLMGGVMTMKQEPESQQMSRGGNSNQGEF